MLILPQMIGSISPISMMFSFSILAIGGALINSQKRNLLFSIRQGNQYFLCLECTMDLRLFLKIWFLIYKRKYQARRSSSGACNLQDIFMVVTGIKMAVACSTSRLRNPSNNGVNKEARQLNLLIEEALQGTDIQLLDLTHLSEFRADAHPSIWLGKKDAVAEWGQDCMHWCLPGVPDTWVDILSEEIRYRLDRRQDFD